jgi:hypothetical protein
MAELESQRAFLALLDALREEPRCRVVPVGSLVR